MKQGKGIRFAAIGEAMIELSGADPASRHLAYAVAGDTLNTAIYLARSLPEAEVSYVSVLGRDRFSDIMVARMADEGLSTDLIGRHPDRLPGLYAIELDEAGERSFRYWRDTSAARTLFSGGEPALKALDALDVIYLSAITLAIMAPPARAALLEKLGDLKASGTIVAFDSNYRPRLWPDVQAARTAIDAAWRVATIALPSLDDESMLMPGAGEDEVLSRIAAFGVEEIALKAGPSGPRLWHAGAPVEAGPFLPAPEVVDTTAAGDSFNAGYLSARLTRAPMAEAALAGHLLACKVIGHQGAILPRS